MELIIFPCLLFLALYSLFSNGVGMIGSPCITSIGTVGRCSKVEQCRNGLEDSQKERWTQNRCSLGKDVVCCDRKNIWPTVSQTPTTKRLKKPSGKVQTRINERPNYVREETPDFIEMLHNKSKEGAVISVPEDAIVFPDFFDNVYEPIPRLDGPEQTEGAVVGNKTLETNQCPPIPEDYAVENNTRTGRKAYDKCLDYAELVFPCQKVEGSDKMERTNLCVEPGFHTSVVGGIEAMVNEFPHMVILGYGNNLDEVAWRCGGSLISELYVMTAGHCIYHPTLGPLKFARFGAHRLTDKPTPEQVILVSLIIKHPDYKPPSKYHDIALVKLSKEVTISASVRPACLNMDPASETSGFMAAGWGATENAGTMSDVLLYVALGGFTAEECGKSNPPSRNLKEGILGNYQVCAGDLFESKDTCQGDSGGPLQSRIYEIYCSFRIIGITSFGQGCGTPGVPGVYTKVSAYVPWIESVVWP